MPATTTTSRKFVYSPRAAQASASNFDGLMQRWSMASRMEASRTILAAEQLPQNFTSWAAYNASPDRPEANPAMATAERRLATLEWATRNGMLLGPVPGLGTCGLHSILDSLGIKINHVGDPELSPNPTVLQNWEIHLRRLFGEMLHAYWDEDKDNMQDLLTRVARNDVREATEYLQVPHLLAVAEMLGVKITVISLTQHPEHDYKLRYASKSLVADFATLRGTNSNREAAILQVVSFPHFESVQYKHMRDRCTIFVKPDDVPQILEVLEPFLIQWLFLVDNGDRTIYNGFASFIQRWPIAGWVAFSDSEPSPNLMLPIKIWTTEDIFSFVTEGVMPTEYGPPRTADKANQLEGERQSGARTPLDPIVLVDSTNNPGHNDYSPIDGGPTIVSNLFASPGAQGMTDSFRANTHMSTQSFPGRLDHRHSG